MRDAGGLTVSWKIALLPALLQFWFVALSSIFVLIDPIAAVPTFLVMTAGSHRTERRKMALRACVTCFVVLSVFSLMGRLIFNVFGITLPAFKIAGGVILGMIALDMVQAKRSPTKETPLETVECTEKEDIGIVPMGVPMLAGPGSISSVMVLVSQNPDWQHSTIIISSIAITAAASFLVLAAAERVGSYLHDTGIRILTRMMGLLLLAISVQFVLNGLTEAGFGRLGR